MNKKTKSISYRINWEEILGSDSDIKTIDDNESPKIKLIDKVIKDSTESKSDHTPLSSMVARVPQNDSSALADNNPHNIRGYLLITLNPHDFLVFPTILL